MASENGAEAEGTQESDNDTENDSQETESSSPETSTEITKKRAVVGVTIVEQLHTQTRRRWKPISIPRLKRRTKSRVN